MNYEVIVVGGGHAGCEAALACSRLGHKTLLITSNIKNIADMPCNPSIGGSAKGIVVREIDALGGEMGRNADKSLLQIKMLNSAKGPAVQSLRAQADKIIYPKEMLKTLQKENNLEIKESIVEDLIVQKKQVKGVVLENNENIYSKMVILTTGTYLKADILVGDTRRREGPHGERPSQHLSDNLKKYGFKVIRLKTGTPQRIDKNSIDFSKASIEKGDDKYLTFSFEKKIYYDKENQQPCYLIYTTPKTHEIIKKNLNKSSIYGGRNDIEGIGPRYCPSIEDKIVRFSDKERHQLFLEPESLYYDDIYIQGFSTSMPHDVQKEMVHSLPGLENAKILKYAYAIEYDAIYPTQLKQTLETKNIENLYTAGQINGTSGYEEAACQGLIAGINASLKLKHRKPLILKRNEAYIGVLIDDLITKGIKDPYRLLTSRAEYRLLLRSDNADLRLTEIGYKVGLISQEKYDKLLLKQEKINKVIKILKSKKVTPKQEVNEYLKKYTSIIKDGITLYDLLKRPEMDIDKIKYFIDIEEENDILEEVEISIKYEGYIEKANKEAKKMLDLESKKIPENIDYNLIHNLASEAKQKLSEIRPTSIGQALRISGVNPSDISILMIYLKKEYKK
ncbi:MAG: tRNA uridine-5-carboxymethylaminomethyl(34) synthesis enzyme MnmG [Clostridium sp.]|nr:tRNA uridine-5-carboxymethylaminomethyl(34) synthesis enzyme MnmG [Clostridium sp.]MCM1443762.1 tRNA uridine-5-carboxymethylaminomethyl(34) synthesis enzyme MnmG [Candidatus Amulumruptor caecigallinarius]